MPLNTETDASNSDVGLGKEAGQESLRSSMVQEIVSRRLGFAGRWALMIYLCIMILLVIGAWFIKYPDVVRANAMLTAANGSKEIVVRQDGKLVNLFVANDGVVVQGQMIGWIESTASHKEVLALSSRLDQAIELLSKNQTQVVSQLFRKGFQGLGELQAPYQQFITSLQQFNDYFVNGYYLEKRKSIVKDQVSLRKMHQSIFEEKKLAEQDLSLTQEAMDGNRTLYDEKVLSAQDLRDQKSKLINKQLIIPQLESNLLGNESMQIAKQKELDELDHAISQESAIFQQSLQTLKSLVDEWKRKYIILSPVNGKLSFVVLLQENQFLQAGKVIGYINPFDTHYYAQITLPQSNFGKIGIGQDVQLRFDAYPYEEFGVVAGKLKYISKAPSDSGYLAVADLPHGLSTNYKRSVQYQSGLRCQALIVTRNTRLLQRLYYSIIKVSHQ